jgi:hypothetical protein
MRGETAFIRGLTRAEKVAIRDRVMTLGLGTENSYWLRLVRADLARPVEASTAAPVNDIAKLIAAGGWPAEERTHG